MENALLHGRGPVRGCVRGLLAVVTQAALDLLPNRGQIAKRVELKPALLVAAVGMFDEAYALEHLARAGHPFDRKPLLNPA